jgi:hypothetical protein
VLDADALDELLEALDDALDEHEHPASASIPTTSASATAANAIFFMLSPFDNFTLELLHAGASSLYHKQRTITLQTRVVFLSIFGFVR